MYVIALFLSDIASANIASALAFLFMHSLVEHQREGIPLSVFPPSGIFLALLF
jgi:hypothetical protein